MLDYSQLEALRAVLRHGSFERAAAALHVTPSAVSQRIRALEEQMGSVLIQRGTPARPTATGQRLLHHAEQVALLEAGLSTDLNGGMPAQGPLTVRAVVNADSLDSWFLRAIGQTDGLLYDISSDDQDVSTQWLRRGDVMAAITANPKPVQGCDCIALGALRYLATASPQFVARYFAGGVDWDAARQAPMLMFNRKDQMQNQWLKRELGLIPTPPLQFIPSTHGFIEAATRGIGWGLNPLLLLDRPLKTGALIAIGANPVFDVPLFWQYNRIAAKALEPLTRAIREVSKECLVPLP